MFERDEKKSEEAGYSRSSLDLMSVELAPNLSLVYGVLIELLIFFQPRLDM